jgi:hypothetical protein
MTLKQDNNMTRSDDRGNGDGQDDFSTATFSSDTTMEAANRDPRRVSHIHFRVIRCFCLPFETRFEIRFEIRFKMMPFQRSQWHPIHIPDLQFLIISLLLQRWFSIPTPTIMVSQISFCISRLF